MVRRSKALFVSVVTHTLLLYGAYALWDVIGDSDKQKSEAAQEICVKLSQYEIKKEPCKPPEEKKPAPPPPPKTVQKKPEPPVIEQKKIENIKKEPPEKEPVPEIEPIKNIEPPMPMSYEPEIKREVYTPPQEPPVPQPVTKKQREPSEAPRSEVPQKEDIAALYAKVNMQNIARLIKENLHYPLSARKRGVQGSVKIRFVLDEEARVRDVKVIESQSDILSRAAIKTVEGLSGKFEKPQETITLTLPISYILN